MKIGILGGSFNPVHNGHLRMAIEVQESIELDRVDLVPAAVPPHKSSVHMLPFTFRLMLLRLAVSSCPRLGVNDLEGYRPGPSYTVDTLREYQRVCPRADLHFLMGSQDLLTLPGWRQWETIVSLTNLVVVWRNGADMSSLEAFIDNHFQAAKKLSSSWPLWALPSDKRIMALQIPELEISSTLIREKWQQGQCLSYLIPPEVEKALEEYEHDGLCE